MKWYLKKQIPEKLQNYIARFRLSSHSLSIETGIYPQLLFKQIDYVLYVMLILNMNSNLFNPLRKLYIKQFYYERPPVFKVLQIFTTQNFTEMCYYGRVMRDPLILNGSIFQILFLKRDAIWRYTLTEM